MDFQNLHVGFPQKKNHPYIDEWIEDAWGKITQINSGWKLRKFKYDEKNNFVPHDQFTAIKSLPGPVLLIEKVQRKSAKILADKINNKFPIDIVDIRSEDQLEKIMLQSIEQYKNYDPFLPRKYVVALLVINKLVQLNMWGGKNKGAYISKYKWQYLHFPCLHLYLQWRTLLETAGNSSCNAKHRGSPRACCKNMVGSCT